MSSLPRSYYKTAYLGLLALGACAPGVAVREAPALRSAQWRALPYDLGETPDNLGAAFGSDELGALIAKARVANPDIAVAAARIVQARGQLGIARAAMLPVVSASAGLSATETDNRGGPLFNFSQGFAGLDISYDVDLFGGGKAERRGARARLAAATFDRDSASLVVEADVARAFVQHAALSDRIALLGRNIGQASELERIIRVRLREGDATRLDVGLQTIQVRQLQTERVRLLEAQSRTRNALAMLVGEEAPLFAIPANGLSPLAIPALAIVQPADLLVRRPDIRAAEARIAAANGDVGQARAAFLPRLRLSGSGLAQAATLTGPIGATLAAGAGLLAPIFNRGRLKGDLAIAAGGQAESVELYRKALLGALAEGEDALTAVERAREREALITEIVAEARITAHLARRQYIEGEADLQRVLDAEQLLVQAEDAGAIAKQERLDAAIDLFRAMGGSPAAAGI